ncbi:Furin/Protein converstase 2 [Giardia muris]|uniref:Furin/Protein converstase 2 n=1 Tax=Giardia muris TaxID=5742 RepID=A0A4Z1TAA4_GIAMU|nr:Furin/Protein converstase 2 [Giardia muris]|eukprot:TNJ30157.1 Furin/Protein converstase 2 [Giardia muris]
MFLGLLVSGLMALTYPSTLDDDLACIVELTPEADIETISTSTGATFDETTALSVPYLYLVPCFPSGLLEEDQILTDLTYDERVAILEAWSALPGVVLSYPNVEVLLDTPASVSDAFAAPASDPTDPCVPPAADYLWFLTGTYVDEDDKDIKTANISLKSNGTWTINETGAGSYVQLLTMSEVDSDDADLDGRIDASRSHTFGTGTGSDSGALGTTLATILAGNECDSYGTRGIAPETTIGVQFYTNPVATLADILQGLYPTNDDATTDNRTAIVATSFALANCATGCCNEIAGLPWFEISENAQTRAIYVFPAGRKQDIDANASPLLRSRSAIVVGSVLPNGAPDPNATHGANLVFSVPVNGTLDGRELGLVGSTSSSLCTNNDGTGCLATISGASGALSIGAGALALVSEALSHSFTTRDVLHVMASSSQIVNNHTQFDKKNGWTLNAGGFFFSNQYGFGILNATKSIEIARGWLPLPEATDFSYELLSEIKCKPRNEVSVTVTIPERDLVRVERLQLAVEMTSGHIGDVSIVLTSPSGTTSEILQRRHTDGSDAISGEIQFLSNAFFGELSPGDWKITFKNENWRSSLNVAGVGLTVTGVPQTTRLDFEEPRSHVYVDSKVHLTWFPTGCTSLVEDSFVDIWITDRLHRPIQRIAAGVPYSNFEYTWDAFKIDLESETYGFFLMVPADSTPQQYQWLPDQVYSPLVRFNLEDTEASAGAFFRPRTAAAATLASIVIVMLALLR